MGFFFTQAEKTSLYSAEFADILAIEPGPDSLDRYLERWDLAGDQGMLWTDLMTYLPDDILAKVDRTSMACSLEVRSPFLDHKVIEWAARLPRAYKYDLFDSKKVLRRLGARLLPAEVTKRAKQGFAVPLNAWLKEPLRPWMEDLLLGDRRRSAAYFEPRALQRMVDDHVSGRRDYSQQLWALMVLEMWLQDEGAG